MARVLRRPFWLVWVCLLLGAPARPGAAPSVTAGIISGGQRHDALASRDLGDPYDTRATPAHRRIDDGPANEADTVDPAGPPALALALTSSARSPALSSVRMSGTVVGPHSFRLLAPLGSRPPPFSF